MPCASGRRSTSLPTTRSTSTQPSPRWWSRPCWGWRRRQGGSNSGTHGAPRVGALVGYLQHTMGDVQTHNVLKGPVGEERFKESPFTTAQVEYPCCTTALQRCHHSPPTLVIQAER